MNQEDKEVLTFAAFGFAGLVVLILVAITMITSGCESTCRSCIQRGKVIEDGRFDR